MAPDSDAGSGVVSDFVAALGRESGGRITAKVDLSYDDGTPEVEARLVHDLAAGKIDAAVVAARGYIAAGVGHLDVLEAPFTLTSYAAERDLVNSPVAAELLSRLDGTGVRGLALVVGPLRRPLSTGRALLTPADWAGRTFGTYSSPMQDNAVRLLGGIPVHANYKWHELWDDGKVQGAETSTGGAGRIGYGAVMLSDVVLWPKVQVVAVSQRFYDSLDAAGRSWLVQAAATVRDLSVAASWDETADAAKVCEAGARFATATSDQLAALRTAIAPVLERLADDPALERLKAFDTAHPTSAIEVPSACRSQTAAARPPSLTPSPTDHADGGPDTFAHLPGSSFG
jgi:TRAP-type C4-dicarboxylate transport system substrate-binding protein